MSRIAVPTREAAPEASKPLLDAVEKQLGVVPNLFRLVSLSPPALQGFLAMNGALAKTLDLKTRERIALAVAELNGCDYCLSAHTYLGLNLAKIDADEIALKSQWRIFRREGERSCGLRCQGHAVARQCQRCGYQGGQSRRLYRRSNRRDCSGGGRERVHKLHQHRCAN